MIMNETTFLSSEGSRQYESITQMLRQVMADQSEIKDQLRNLTSMRDALAGSIKMDSLTLEIVLNVSDSTLYRWRASSPPNHLPHYKNENGSIYYLFEEVMKALRKGQLNARGFNRLQAIENMAKYRDEILNSKDGSSWLCNRH